MIYNLLYRCFACFMVAFTIGPITVYWYGIMYLLSFLGWYIFLYTIVRSSWTQYIPRVQKVLRTHLDDLFTYIIVGVMLGGRLGEVLFYNLPYYFSYPAKIFAVWEGGMSFAGGIIGVVLALLLFARRVQWKVKDVVDVLDLLVVFLPMGIILWRFGNFLNQELYGLPVRVLSPRFSSLLESWNLVYVYDRVDTLMRVNTNFLAIVGEGFLILWILLFIFVIWYRKWLLKTGLLSGVFLFMYSLVRFFLDYLRVDAQTGASLLTVSQRIFIGMACIGLYLLLGKNNFCTKRNS